MRFVYCANNNSLYETPKEAAEQLELDLSLVSRALNGRRPRAGVYLLAYVDIEPQTAPKDVQSQLDELRRWMLYSVYKIVLPEV